MRYLATVNKKFRYVKVYNVIKKVNQSSNFVSDLMAKFVDKYLLKRKEVEE